MGAPTASAVGHRLPRPRDGREPPPDPRSRAAAEWRRICLDRQLPRARFPAGVAAPVLVCFWCLVLVSGLALAVWGGIGYGGSGGRAVPGAVVDSQKQLVGRLARTQRAVLANAVDGLTNTAARFADGAAANPDPLLAAVVDPGAGSRWRAAAILDADRKPVAFRGEQLPADAAAKAVPGRAVPLPPAGTGLTVVVAATLPGGRLLAAVTGLELRALRLNAKAQQSVFIAGPGGASYAAQGAAVPAEGQPQARLVRRAVAAADDRAAGVTASPVTITDPQTGQARRLAPVVAAAPIGDTGLAVVSVTHSARVATAPPARGREAALALAAVALLVLGLVYIGLIRPVNRTLEQAKRVACGEIPRQFRPPVLREAGRISAALASIVRRPRAGSGRSGSGGPGYRRPVGVPAVLVVAICAVAVGGWSAAVASRYARGATSVPTQVSVDARNDIEGAAAALRDGLTGGLARLRAAAAAAAAEAPPPAAGPSAEVSAAASAGSAPIVTGAATPNAVGATGDGVDPGSFVGPLGDLVADGDLRSAYLVGPDGRPVVRTGEEPNRVRAAPPAGSGIRLDRVTGPVPVVYAYVQVSERHTLIAEFGVRYLAGLLHRADGRVRVLDPDLRTILDTGGYVPFRVPAAEPVRTTATDALENRAGTAIGTVQGTRMLLAGATVGGDEELPDLRWAIVAERPVVAFRLPDNELSRGTWLVAFLALVLAALLFAWYRLVVIRPLRRMAEAAELLAAGDLRTTIHPVRQDEVGAIALCLDIVRQTLAEGPDRLAGAVRLRGIGSEITMVLPIVKPEGIDSPGTRRASRSRIRAKG
jgi:HAMP domain-containing protein